MQTHASRSSVTDEKISSGYRKIKGCCELARIQGYPYVWIDTCCIDKKSSAELSEAINSMYAWYARSAICYVYLSDVKIGTTEPDFEQAFCTSRWYSRGWTLQELLAPKEIIFYDRYWRFLGSKQDLLRQVSKASGIEGWYLEDRRRVHLASVANRMSWAAKRETTRPEDIGYCLMGLFGVNMPLLYGEGRKAFIRLQYEISRETDDESLFAWHSSDHVTGIFATSPDYFGGSANIEPGLNPAQRVPHNVTNKGLVLDSTHQIATLKELNRPVGGAIRPDVQRAFGITENEYGELTCLLVPLDCGRKGETGKPFTIILIRESPNVYARVFPAETRVYEKYWNLLGQCEHRMIYVRTYMGTRGDFDEWSKASTIVGQAGALLVPLKDQQTPLQHLF
ncbi:MAG: hypothetical protein Q9208_003405 [Pyrenodesmia sp. 3 TL-2023]